MNLKKYCQILTIKIPENLKLPSDFSGKKYKKDIVLLKDTTEPVVFMYSRDADGIDFYAKIQCNNMIPVPGSELIKVDVNSETDSAYKGLLQKEINFTRCAS